MRASAAEATSLLWRAAPRSVLGYVLATLAGALSPVAVAWLTKLVIDRLTHPQGAAAGGPGQFNTAAGGPGQFNTVGGLAFALVVTGSVIAAVPVITRYLRAHIGRVASMVATDRLFVATERQVGLRRFEDPAFLDRLGLAQEAAKRGMELLDGIGGVLGGVLTLFGFVGSLLVLSPVLTTLVLLAAVPAFAAEFFLTRRRASVAWRVERFHRQEFFYSRLLTGVEAATEIRLFGIGSFLRARMIAERRKANTAYRAMDLRELRAQGGLTVLSAAVAGIGLWWAIDAARRGALSVGDIAMFIAAVDGVQSALSSLIWAISASYERLLGFAHYVAVVRAEPDLPVAATGGLPGLARGIELRDVWFRYSDDHPWVLTGVNLKIPRGTAIALVGLNGAGKTTLVKLLCRMYDPTRGQVLWDGTDLRDIPPAALRDRISAVFQDHMHYDMTAAENIGLGDLPAMDDAGRLADAAVRAGIHDKIAGLPWGYDTPLTRVLVSGNDRDDPRTGVVLSGGQWQRLALARALVRDSRDLMILDEPSSGLDPLAEHEIHVRMREYRAGRTSLLISHRLSAVRDADAIAVLDGGQISEYGTHDELLAAEGGYARLFRLQAEGYQEVR